jgi:CheY-like chemotaxis protein
MASVVSPEDGLARLNVLVVDDNGAMRGTVRAILTAFGARVVYEASSAKQAIAVLKDMPVDLMICDWKMPDMDGVTLVRKLRKSEPNPAAFMPVIMLTAYSERVRVAEARDAGVTEFLVKPISPEALYRRIQAVINKPRPFVRTKVFFGPDRRRRDIALEGEDRRSEATG